MYIVPPHVGISNTPPQPFCSKTEYSITPSPPQSLHTDFIPPCWHMKTLRSLYARTVEGLHMRTWTPKVQMQTTDVCLRRAWRKAAKSFSTATTVPIIYFPLVVRLDWRCHKTYDRISAEQEQALATPRIKKEEMLLMLLENPEIQEPCNFYCKNQN